MRKYEYERLTTYLSGQHHSGNNVVILSLDAIEKILGGKLTLSPIRYTWQNAKCFYWGRCSLEAGFIASCNYGIDQTRNGKEEGMEVTFTYNPQRAQALL